MTATKKVAAAKVDSGATGAPESTAAELEAKDPALTQFPSLAGAPDVEIAERSADVHKHASAEHRKVYVIPRNPLVEDYSGDEYADMHKANIDGMRQAMILQGLRPTEDGRFIGAEDHPDGQSVCLTYACSAVPAAVATPEQSQVRVTVDDQHELDKVNGK